MVKPVIVGLGEVLFDIVGSSEELGGAPANFAYHAGRLGAEAYIISTVGDDERGGRALKQLQDRGLATECITTLKGAETGYVRADIDAEGVASYHFPDDIAWDNLELNDHSLAVIGRADGICFGTLAQRSEQSRKTISRCLDLLPEKALKVYDINLRQDFYSKDTILKSLKYADILKLNDDEIIIVAELLDMSGSQLDILQSLVAEYDLKLAVLTRGAEGSLLVIPDSHSDYPGTAIEEVKDTIGAGDSFTASTLINFLAGEELNTINKKANELAALVCGHQGAMPEI